MNNVSKPIRLCGHAKEQVRFRGTTEEEVREAIRIASWKPAEMNRMECLHEFTFKNTWNNRFYERKQVRPIFVEEKGEIVVVTVYVYYS